MQQRLIYLHLFRMLNIFVNAKSFTYNCTERKENKIHRKDNLEYFCDAIVCFPVDIQLINRIISGNKKKYWPEIRLQNRIRQTAKFVSVENTCTWTSLSVTTNWSGPVRRQPKMSGEKSCYLNFSWPSDVRIISQ